MKKSKNKFIIGVIFLVLVTLIVQLYISYFTNRIDTNSYISLLKGQGTLNEEFLDVEMRQVLLSGDKVRIIGQSSLALIEWGDGSLTRLAGNTKISIGEANVSKDYTKINISFDLISGKTWSNVVSFLGNDSYFKQSFDNVEAGVRGTVFDVDLDNNYVHVLDHQISLTKQDGTEILISEDEPFSLETFSFINFSEFVSSIKDQAWHDINANFDKEYLLGLKAGLENNLEKNNPLVFLLELFNKKYRILYELDHGQDFKKIQKMISTLSTSKKVDLYDKALSEYQKINFVKTDDPEFYGKKVLYKRALLLLSDNAEEKEFLVRGSLFDFQDLMKTKDIGNIGGTLSILNENKDILKSLDVSSILKYKDILPEDFKEILGENFNDLKSLLNINTGGIGVDNVKDLKKKAEGKIADGLDSIYNIISN